jgi:hypothetical protein
MNQRRSEQPDAGSGKGDAGAEAFELLIADRLVQKRSAAAAVFFRPGYSEPTALVQFAMPSQRRFPANLFFVGQRTQGWN